MNSLKKIIYFTNIKSLDSIDSSVEIILEHKEFSRFGKLETSDFNHVLGALKQKGHRVSFEWDVLMTESEFPTVVEFFKDIHMDLIDEIRVQDPGAIEFVREFLKHPVTLILETGNHNLLGIQTWISILGDRVKKVSLSPELDKNKLKEFSDNLDVEIEFLGLGRILIFYTPRSLLGALLPEDDEKKTKSLNSSFLTASGESEESPHKGFPLLENKHGTFMFHIKRLYLLDCLDDLIASGVESVRIDNRFDDENHLAQIFEAFENNAGKEFKSVYPYDVIKGYFNINKTDVLFKKLKNYRLQRKDDSYIGEVLETNKAAYMAILVKKNSLSLGDEVKFITPEGKELYCKVFELTNSTGVNVDTVAKNELGLMNYFGSVWPKSQVYKIE
jgi:putative protease